jgi:hypothetical protein
MASRRIGNLAVTLLLVGGLALCSPLGGMIRVEWRRYNLLQRTDHSELLAACRQVITTFAGVHREAQHPFVRACLRSSCANDARIPEAIRRLDPTEIAVSPDAVRVELWGGFAHFGFEAVRDGAPAGAVQVIDHAGGRKQLRDGLWFYDIG